MFGEEAVCPDGLFVPAVFRESDFYLNSLISSMIDGLKSCDVEAFYVCDFLHLFVSPGQPCGGVHQDSHIICDENHKL